MDGIIEQCTGHLLVLVAENNLRRCKEEEEILDTHSLLSFAKGAD